MINALQKIVSENFIEPADFEFRMKNFDDALSVVQFQGDLLIVSLEPPFLFG